MEPNSSADAEVVADLARVAKVPDDRQSEALRYILSRLEWLRFFIDGLAGPTRVSEFNRSLDEFAKHAKRAARAWKNLRENHGTLFGTMAQTLDPWWHVVAERMPLDERLDAAAELAERFTPQLTKPRDWTRHQTATFALRFFEKFSSETPSYALTGANPFIEFCNGLYELITGDEADLSTYARQVIEEVQGKRPSPYGRDEMD